MTLWSVRERCPGARRPESLTRLGIAPAMIIAFCEHVMMSTPTCTRRGMPAMAARVSLLRSLEVADRDRGFRAAKGVCWGPSDAMTLKKPSRIQQYAL